MDDNTESKTISTGTLLKSSFWYTLSNFLTRSVGFITIPIFTRILTKAEIGNFSNYASWQHIMVIICGIEIYNTINRARFDYPEEKDFNTYITSCLVLSTIITGVVFGLYLLFSDIFYKVLLIDHKYMVFMFMYLFTYPAYSMFQIKQRITYKYKLSAGIMSILVLASSALAIFLSVHIKGNHLSGRIYGQYSLYILTGLVFYIHFLLKSLSVKAVYFRYALRIGLPLVFSYLGSSVLLSSDSFVVKHMCLDEQVGYIALIHTATHIVLIMVSTLNNAWAPWFYDKLNGGQTDTIRRTYKAYVWLVIGSTFLVLLLGPEIIKLLGGKEYNESIYILPANILNGVFTVLSVQMVNLEIFYKKPEYSAIITGIVAVVNIGMNIVGVHLWDYRAVCYTTVICNILSILIHYGYTQRMNVKAILSPKDLIQFILMALLLIPISLLLYRFSLCRILFIILAIIAIIITTIINKDVLINVLKKSNKQKKL